VKIFPKFIRLTLVLKHKLQNLSIFLPEEESSVLFFPPIFGHCLQNREGNGTFPLKAIENFPLISVVKH